MADEKRAKRQKKLNRQLYLAACEGSLESVREALKIGADPNYQGDEGLTPPGPSPGAAEASS